MTKLAFPYIRMSTKEQLEGDSLARQSEIIMNYCERKGLQIAFGKDLTEEQTIQLFKERFADIGRSAFHGKHIKDEEAKLRLFLLNIEQKKIPKGSALVIENLDRLSRLDVNKAYGLFSEIINAGIEVHVINTNDVYTSNMQFHQILITLASFHRAHEDSQRKSDTLTSSWDNKHKEAIKTKKPFSKIVPAWLKVENDKIEEIPERVEIVRRIFKMNSEGIGRDRIAQALNNEMIEPWGRKNKKGKMWYKSTVTKIIKNEAVLGTHTTTKLDEDSGRRIPNLKIENYYPQIITQQLFDKANYRNTNTAGNKGYFSNLFQGLTHCSKCGARMHLINKGGNDLQEQDEGKYRGQGKFLVCSNAHHRIRLETGDTPKPVCDYEPNNYEQIEDSLLRVFKFINLDQLVHHEKKEALNAEMVEIETQIGKVQNSLDAANKSIKQILDEGNRVPSQISQNAANYETQIEFLKDELNEKFININSTHLTDKEITQLIDQIAEKDFTIRARVNSALKDVIENIELTRFKTKFKGFKFSKFMKNPVTQASITLKGGYQILVLIHRNFNEYNVFGFGASSFHPDYGIMNMGFYQEMLQDRIDFQIEEILHGRYKNIEKDHNARKIEFQKALEEHGITEEDLAVDLDEWREREEAIFEETGIVSKDLEFLRNHKVEKK